MIFIEIAAKIQIYGIHALLKPVKINEKQGFDLISTIQNL